MSNGPEGVLTQYLSRVILFTLEGNGRDPFQFQKIVNLKNQRDYDLEREVDAILCSSIETQKLNSLLREKWGKVRFVTKKRLGCRIEKV